MSGGGYLHLADLDARPFRLKQKLQIATSSMTSTTPSALAYSEDERYLLLQLGNSLTAYDLLASPPIELGVSAADISEELLTGGSQATAPCLESYPTSPARWCGSADRRLPFAWAHDSRYLAYRTLGKLMVADLTLFPVTTAHSLVANNCNQRCASQFAFQPQP